MVYVTTYQLQKKGRVRLGFDNGMEVTAYDSEIRPFHISKEAAMTEEEFHGFMEVIAKRAKKRALHLLEQMDRTEAKLREKLKLGGYPECCIDEAIAYVKSYHYLDDNRYAFTYVRYRQEKMSRRQLFTKLLARGISGELAGRAIAAEYVADEQEQIEKLLKKRQFSREQADDREFRRMYQYLARRGFNSSEILRSMK